MRWGCSAIVRGVLLVPGLVPLLVIGSITDRVAANASTSWPSKVHGNASPNHINSNARGKTDGGSLSVHRAKGHAKEKGVTPGLEAHLGTPGAQYVTDDALSFTTSNEYPAVQQSTWAHVAEPYRATTFKATSNIGNPDEDVFKWFFEDGTVLEGKEVRHTFTKVGSHAVALAQTVVSTGDIKQLHDTVMVKYVRREIRQLKNADREAFFDAMETLYRLPTAEGNARFGDDYKGIHYFVQMHLNGAGTPDCDHWHDDAGIMTHHVGYTLQFEQALQVVDPSVSIPYWEYTIEASNGLNDYDNSEVFADDWFGAASPDNKLHTVERGRWAYLSVMENAWDYVHNPYGLLRTPWNTDPTPFVTRHNTTNSEDLTSVVSCDQYQSCFDKTAVADINNCLNGGTHGPVHIKLGGEWNDPDEDLVISMSYADEVPMMTKFLWRKGYLRLPTSCSTEEHGVGDESTCRASCPAEVYENLGMKPYDVLMDTLLIHWIAPKAGGVIVYNDEKSRFEVAGHEDDEDFSDEFWLRILNSLCDPGHVGELFTSSAPYDPLFWVIHPTADRLLAWRRKLAVELPNDWPLDETWGYSHGWVIGETGITCDWSDVREGSLDMPTCTTGICGGHNENDLLPFLVKVKGETVQMTNAEWYDFIYPDNDDLPYMYNEFSWDHCASEGVHLGTKYA